MNGIPMTAFRQLHVVGVIGDAPARDVDEMIPCTLDALTDEERSIPISGSLINYYRGN